MTSATHTILAVYLMETVAMMLHLLNPAQQGNLILHKHCITFFYHYYSNKRCGLLQCALGNYQGIYRVSGTPMILLDFPTCKWAISIRDCLIFCIIFVCFPDFKTASLSSPYPVMCWIQVWYKAVPSVVRTWYARISSVWIFLMHSTPLLAQLEAMAKYAQEAHKEWAAIFFLFHIVVVVVVAINIAGSSSVILVYKKSGTFVILQMWRSVHIGYHPQPLHSCYIGAKLSIFC